MRLGQDEKDREKDDGEAGQGQQHLGMDCLECIHRRRPLELESDTGRGRPRLLAASSRVAIRKRWQDAALILSRNVHIASCNSYIPG